VDGAGKVTLAKSYQPYGAEISSGGSGYSNFGFTGEMTDPTGLTYLRARYYASDTGRFISRDTWGGNYNRPLSLNRWNYTDGNPVNLTDPNGKSPLPDAEFQACVSSVQLGGVEQSMQVSVCRTIAELEGEGYLTNLPDAMHISSGRRTDREAHKFSTVYHILHDFVSIDDLRKTPKDLDGNIWYKEEWDVHYCAYKNSNLDPRIRTVARGYLDYLIKRNASNQTPYHLKGRLKGTIYTPYGSIMDVAYGLEGYEAGDPKRLPNSSYPGLSRHVSGWAVDIGGLDDVKQIDIWTEQKTSAIDKIAYKHGLHRPYNNTQYFTKRACNFTFFYIA
jgi:RHS repeat-associated protein